MKRLLIHFISFVIVFFFLIKGHAQKTDTIVHVNGNTLTGDLKKMEYGVATWKMDGMGTISLEEVVISSIRSKKYFEIKLKSGVVYFGSFGYTDIYRKVRVVRADSEELINMHDIVEIYPIKNDFWKRTTGNFSLGANFSKGNDGGTIAYSGNMSYRKKKISFDLDTNINYVYKGDSLSSNKSGINLGWERLLKKHWSTGLTVGATQNSELGTKLRLTISAVGIRDVSYNNWQRLYVAAGLNVDQETPYDDSGVTEDLAGLFQTVWKVYKYSSPKIWVNASINYLPYFTGPSRHRASVNLNPQVSVFSNNFKVGFTSYYNYDSNPTSGASTNDYGLNLQLTYTLH